MQIILPNCVLLDEMKRSYEKMKKILNVLCVAAILLACASCGSNTQPASGTQGSSPNQSTSTGAISIGIGHNQNESHPLHLALLEFEKEVEEKSNGTLQIDLYPNGTLGDNAQMIDQVSLGSSKAAFILGGPIFAADIDGRGNIEELPFLFSDINEARAAYDGAFGDYCISEIIEPCLNIKVLGFWENGFRQFTNDIRPINVPADMADIKFRVPSSIVREWTFDALNASAIPMAWTEVFTALQQRTIDGQENPMSVICSSSLWEVQDYLSIGNYMYNTGMLIINPAFWDTLTAEQQEIISNASVVGRDYMRALCDENNEAYLKECEENGMKINYCDTEAFVEAVQPVWDKFRAEYGSEIIDIALESAK